MQNEVLYILTKSKRKNISLSVNKRGQVEVKSPFFVSKEVIDDFVLSKKAWIENVQSRISFLTPTPKAETAHDLAKQKILAKRLIIDRIAYYNSDERFRFRKVTVKAMSSRWGSCSYQGNLNFNYRLAYLDLELVDYVVVHELCHLIEHNHSARFWLEVKKIIPDYKVRERKIKMHLLC